MPPYLQRGSIPRKRHIAHRREGGHRGEGMYYEEVVTTAGFGRAYSICYHLRPPTRVVKVEPAGEVAVESVTQKALRHHHLKSGQLKREGDPITGRVPLLVNGDLMLARCRPAKPQAELFRNADADEVVFVHRGQGTLHTMLGPLPVRPFDYVVIPRCTTYRLEFDAAVAPICSSSRRPAASRSRRAISIRTASFAWGRRTPSATCTGRRKSRSSIATRRRRCSSRTAAG